jgi:hypothetical protein
MIPETCRKDKIPKFDKKSKFFIQWAAVNFETFSRTKVKSNLRYTINKYRFKNIGFGK